MLYEHILDIERDKAIELSECHENSTETVEAMENYLLKFNEMLDSSGLGNHPEMIRFLHRVGKAISEDSVVVGGTTTSQLTREAVLYPSMQN